ncbi:TIP-1 family-domain-containing protein [Russula earlei]|uniref:TIP-1 family-domain-containing protein n=1 Tax=Russula earlei TaxID=71964 RepID=A0ACC0UKY5_9AGAM|nr:TIP-1 family-domain-containing protein [Russula earlei]
MRRERDNLRVLVAASTSSIQKLRSDQSTSASLRLHSAQELSLLGHSLIDELSLLFGQLLSDHPQSNESPTLLEDLEAMHRSLREQESIRAYVQVVQRALQLSEAAKAEITPHRAITVSKYRSLQAFVSAVKHGCAPSSDVLGEVDKPLRLVSFLEEIQKRTWLNMKAVLSSALLVASENLHWPMPVDYASASPEHRKVFESTFRVLLDFQEIGETLHPDGDQLVNEDGLYSIQALVQPLSQRFKYHFEGTRQTNRPDKPEWYFAHILDVSHQHRSFFDTVIQHLLASTKFSDVNAWGEFTCSLLPILSRHIRRTIPSLLPNTPLLAHTIYQALAFDASLREAGFSLYGTFSGRLTDEAEWKGISDVVLGRKEWFDRWIEAEKAFAMGRYNEILGAKDAWTITDDAAESDDYANPDNDIRPTVSARQLKALVEQVTDRYSPLPNFTHRTRFLIDVQLFLLEGYYSRISSSLDAFESLSSSLVRAVPGALGATSSSDTRGRLTAGVEGIMRLCKALVSTRYISTAMETWGEDLFFLELWTEINHKASLRARADTHPSLPSLNNPSSDAAEGTIFEELVRQYEKLVTRTEDMIVQQVCTEVEAAWKTRFASQGTHSDMIISPTLLPAVSLLSSHLTALRRTLPRANINAIYRRIGSYLSDHILQGSILYRRPREVTDVERKALQRECELWVETCRFALPGAGERVEVPWRRLVQAGRILGADDEVWTQILARSFDDVGLEEWETRAVELIGGAELSRDEWVTAALLEAVHDAFVKRKTDSRSPAPDGVSHGDRTT